MSMLDAHWPHRDHWLTRVAKLDAAVPGKYCWAGLAALALYGPDEYDREQEGVRCADDCKAESLEEGSCYCGKFCEGHLRNGDE